MSYLVFARKYRPQTFEQVIQQDHVTRTLANAITAGRVSHAILFTGPRGTGKTTVARILAKSMNCVQGPTATPCNQCRSCQEITDGHAADVFEIDGASNNSVDQVRELRENLKYMPARSRYKIYIIDEVHMLSLAAFNALLKTLEEPPEHVLFIFATTEPHKIPVTIMSRCQRHDLRRIELSSIMAHMQHICEREGVSIGEESLSLIAQESGGSMRDSLSLLDHVLSCADGEVSPDLVAELLGAAERKHLFGIASAVFSRDIQSVLQKIDMVWRYGLEMKRFYTDLVTHFYHLTMLKMGDRAADLVDLPGYEKKLMTALVKDIPGSYLTQVLDVLIAAEPSIRFASQPKLALEMVFMKLFQAAPTLPIETLIDHLDQLRTIVPQSAVPQSAVPGENGRKTTVQETQPEVQRSDSQNQHGEPENAKREVVAAPPSVSEIQLPGEKIWEQIIGHTEENKPSLAGFLKKCQVVKKTQDSIEIEVGGNAFTYKSVQKQMPYLEEICISLFGRKLSFELTANCEDETAKQEAREQAEQKKKEALSHPLVMASLELFNGKVVDVKVP